MVLASINPFYGALLFGAFGFAVLAIVVLALLLMHANHDQWKKK